MSWYLFPHVTRLLSWSDHIYIPYIHDPSAELRLTLPANGDLDRDGLPLVSHLTVLSAIHCSTGFTLDTSEGHISDINQCHFSSSKAVVVEVEEEAAGGVEKVGGASRFNVGLRGALGWSSGRVGWGQAHGRPYPLSCFMATGLNGAWNSISASCRWEPCDSGRCRMETVAGSVVLSQESPLLNITVYSFSICLSCTPSVRRVEHLQHAGSQTQLGGGNPMVPVRERKFNL